MIPLSTIVYKIYDLRLVALSSSTSRCIRSTLRPAQRTSDSEMAKRLPLRILLAEDNLVNQKVALLTLARLGYRADIAGNGLEVLDALARQSYDLVLMDVQMSELDGLSTTQRIWSEIPLARRPRIVAMTANAMQGDHELCLAAGMDDYICKPVRIDELIRALERSASVRQCCPPATADHPGLRSGADCRPRDPITGRTRYRRTDRAAQSPSDHHDGEC